MSILIVEDSDIDALIIEKILKQESYITVRARNGNEALQILSINHAIRLIFSDILMPEMDGLQMVQRMKEQFASRTIPVVFCSSLSDIASVRTALGLGCMSYILKPIRRQVLLEKVASAIEKNVAPITEVVPATVAPTKPKNDKAEYVWQRPELISPGKIEIQGLIGQVYSHALFRLEQPPYAADWLLSEVSFKIDRPRNNFSGDLLGRFLQLTRIEAAAEPQLQAVLKDTVLQLCDHQAEDGHFGLPVNWKSRGQVIQLGVPILWGNGRLLNGLVTAYKELKAPVLLQAARRLADFYVATADLLSPYSDLSARFYSMPNSEMSASYFPAIEGLVELFTLTSNDAYLALAERFSNYFRHLENPIFLTQSLLTSHCGLLALYAATKKVEYLHFVERAWERGLNGKCIWPTGGVGRFFSPRSQTDEGCSEAEWLRLNLGLWHATGHSRYLHMADRVVHNALVTNQLAAGGFGNRNLEPTREGPIALLRKTQENLCCSLSGFNALHQLKSHLVYGNEAGVYLNFLVDCATTVHAGGQNWRFALHTVPPPQGEIWQSHVEIEALDSQDTPHIGFFFLLPAWATGVKAFDPEGNPVALTHTQGLWYGVYITQAHTVLELVFEGGICLENRNLQRIQARKGFMREVVLRAGPQVLFAAWNMDLPPTILLMVDDQGRATLPQDKLGRYLTAVLQDETLIEEQAASEVADCQPLYLAPWQSLPDSARKIFIYKAVIVKSDSLLHKAIQSAADRINTLL